MTIENGNSNSAGGIGVNPATNADGLILNINNVEVSHCQAGALGYNGGGISIRSGNLYNCYIHDCTSPEGIGGIFTVFGPVTISNTTIANDTGQIVGALQTMATCCFLTALFIKMWLLMECKA